MVFNKKNTILLQPITGLVESTSSFERPTNKRQVFTSCAAPVIVFNRTRKPTSRPAAGFSQTQMDLGLEIENQNRQTRAKYSLSVCEDLKGFGWSLGVQRNKKQNHVLQEVGMLIALFINTDVPAGVAPASFTNP